MTLTLAPRKPEPVPGPAGLSKTLLDDTPSSEFLAVAPATGHFSPPSSFQNVLKSPVHLSDTTSQMGQMAPGRMGIFFTFRDYYFNGVLGGRKGKFYM